MIIKTPLLALVVSIFNHDHVFPLLEDDPWGTVRRDSYT